MMGNVLKKIVKKLNRAKEEKKISSFGLIGAMAVARWGIPRATSDFDFFISLGDNSLSEVATYLQGSARSAEVGDSLNGVITFNEFDVIGEIPVLLMVFPKKWEELILSGLEDFEFEGASIPMANWKTLVLLKLYAGSSRDLEDANGILALQKLNQSDKDWLKKTASSMRVSKRLGKILES